MTRKLEELFDLPISETADTEEPVVETPVTRADLAELDETIDKIDQALPGVKGLESSDDEMDELAKKASETFDDLMDLGMNVDSRYASEIFAVAGTMLGHALTAKTAKLNKKLKMIELQLKKATLDHKMSEKTEELDNTPIGSGQTLDRNELLKMLSAKTTDK